MKFTNKLSYPLILLFFLGAGIRALDVWRPADGRVREIWRECDIAAVARNFNDEGMNILYPRIDWRGDGPGYAEMEFPMLSWSTALLYKIFGLHEVLGRLLSYFFSLLTLVVFFRFAQHVLEPLGTFIASAFFAFSPALIRVSNALQPEAMMLFFYTLAVYAFIRWLDERKWIWYGIALAGTVLSVLAKVNAAHIGLFFLALLLFRRGIKGMVKAEIFAFGVGSLLPSALWYIHAHRFWLEYGNSLGVSNEHHWVGWDFFTNPQQILGLIKIELGHIWMPLGALVAIYAVVFCWSKKPVKISFIWLVSIFIYYILTIRTTGDNWATYYHVVSIPPAALLIGQGIEHIQEKPDKRLAFPFLVGISLLFFMAIIILRLFGWTSPSLVFSGVVTFFLSAGFVVVFIAISRNRSRDIPSIPLGRKRFFTYGLLFSLVSTFLFQGFRISKDLFPRHFQSSYECAQSLKPLIDEDALILASGGPAMDENGYPLAINASQMFYWLERKGFSLAREDQSISSVKSFLKRGAEYFVLDTGEMNYKPGFFKALQEEFTLIAECSGTYLFKLSP